MKSRLKAFAAVALASLVLSAAFPLQSSAAGQCQPQIDAALQQHGVATDEIESMKVVKQSRGAKSANNFALDAWIRLKGCTGYLMVNMTRSCHVQQVYTSGDCELDSMPSY
jgi:hypothetical protein